MSSKRFFPGPQLDPAPEKVAQRKERLEAAKTNPRPAPLSVEEKERIEADQFMKLQRDVIEKRTVWESRPYYVQLSAHNICNLDCIMCWDGIHPTPVRMTEEQIQMVADEVLPTASVIIPHSGSEPSLPGFIDVVPDAARRYQTQIQFITNATYLDRANYERIRDTVAMIQVSLDAHTRESFAKIRVGADYDEVFDNLRKIVEWTREDGIEVAVSFVFLKCNAYEMPDFVRYMGGEIGVDRVIIQQLYDNNERGNELDAYGNIPPEDIERLRKETIAAAHEIGVDLTMGLGEFEWFHLNKREMRTNKANSDSTNFLLYHHRSFCQQAAQYMKVDVNGDVYPCCQGGEKPDILMGNVFESSVEEVWNGERYQKLREDFFNGELRDTCRQCTFYKQNSQAKPYEIWVDFERGTDRAPTESTQGFHVNMRNLTWAAKNLRGQIKVTDDHGEITRTIGPEQISLEPRASQSAFVEIDLDRCGLQPHLEIIIEDADTGDVLASREITHHFAPAVS